MKLNSTLSNSALVTYEAATWHPSPAPGVSRMMLERVGDEKVSRATSVVRYAPGSSFSSHRHDGGEEFLVLDGTFSDATGNFTKGFYIRNPVGSDHAPWSKTGTEIFVKLGQIDPADKSWVRLDTQGADWRCHEDPGLRTLVLHRFDAESVRLVELKAGTDFPEVTFRQGVEIFVVSGSLQAFETSLETNDWLRKPAGSNLAINSQKGATFYIKTGHLGTGATLP